MSTLPEIETAVTKDQTPVDEKVNGNGVEHKAVSGMNGAPTMEKGQEEMKIAGKEAESEAPEKEVKKEDVVALEVEPKTGVSFPVKLDDGKQLTSVGLRKKYMLGMGIKIYGFGMYTDNDTLQLLWGKLTDHKEPS